ncbi:MAG: hypothetical protein EBU90_11455 [Proteobacteria bacterium]|nr:hypothetical protein [Pseudomonadota bacterium]NBP14595.1 hypothetical protein [bacterium]
MALIHNQYTINRDRLALYYDFTAAKGTSADNSTVLDLSGNARNATRNLSYTSSSASQPRRFATFGTGSAYRLQTSYTYSAVTALTYEMWIRTSDATYAAQILAQNRGTSLGAVSGISLTFGLTPIITTSGFYSTSQFGRLALAIDSNSLINLAYTDIAVNDGQWHHVVGLFSRASGTIVTGDFQIWVDGQNRTLTTGPNAVSSSTSPITGLGGMTFGWHFEWNRSVATPGGHFNGDMTRIRVYERALGAQEIQANYVNERPLHYNL